MFVKFKISKKLQNKTVCIAREQMIKFFMSKQETIIKEKLH